ncbi:phosphoribosylaminoimidazolesuccinocarboxamide synthase [Candidatus Peregrinibacteria bacterium CG_4_9_14_0_2_um_filter_41_14]|nr:MAG: phosphoribosylaminoimidazolesuccinocarboxamide synthase [Candidatus Peregrinibacteria bacterium CG_4_10_14_0_2_um_filter_41_8]PJC37573.1 MAG: phosphoribosylaminoimidazolesuccinocarboxamide synthase [Candidatus Peregrinibacteria bacterium CG_4_9_14_0_2_um_filter_41_14]
MLTDDVIKAQIPYTLSKTDMPWLGEKYEGKVRDNYTKGDLRTLVVTDKLSAFDRIITTIPFKGQVLNQIAMFWFEQTKNICPNHVVATPDPNCVIAKQCEALPVEMVVRGYITGSTSTSIWYNYQKGVRNFCGNPLPEGLQKNQKLAHPIITPSTKAAHGDHDESVSKEEILSRNTVSEADFDYMAEKAMELYLAGVEHCAEQGIIFVDTKYEFGRDQEGNIMLIDEIHTPDSSRFWIADTYQQKIANGEEPDNINKEYLRLWLANQGYMGDGEMPAITDEVRIETAKKYIEAYEKITGLPFQAEAGPVLDRIEQNLKNYFA